MQKKTREILAVVLLVVLGLAAACAMGWYILAGHNWNHAATQIDDLIGSMDNYTVIVYEGAKKTTKSASGGKSASTASEPATAGAPGAPDVAGAPSASAAAAPSASASSASAASASSADASSASVSSTGAASATSASSASASSASASSTPSTAGTSAASGASSTGSKAAESTAGAAKQSKKALTAEEVADSYRQKGAEVVVLSRDGASQYDAPTILLRNGKRIGILYFDGKARRDYADFRDSVRYLQKHEVDLVIAVVNDKAMLKRSLSGVDLLVLMRDGGIASGGTTVGSTMCVDSPGQGKVQAVIISPSGVMTSRTIEEL